MRIRTELRERFARLAHELARGQNMPSAAERAYESRRATPKTNRSQLIEEAKRATDQCEDWALEVLGLLDALEAPAPRRRS